MARGFTAAFETELAAGLIKPRLFWSGDFGIAVGDPIRLWTGQTNITFSGDIYQGNGWLHDVSPIKETTKTEAVGARVTLTGVPLELISLVLQNNLEQGASGKIWLGFLNSAEALIADPHLIFEGDFDYTTIQDSGTTAEISVHYESTQVALRRPKTHRYTDEGQQALFPNDRGFEYVAFLKDWSGFWGQQEATDNG